MLARVLEVFEHLSDQVLIMLVFVSILVVLVLLWLDGWFPWDFLRLLGG